jgi:hypothetical protein
MRDALLALLRYAIPFRHISQRRRLGCQLAVALRSVQVGRRRCLGDARLHCETRAASPL